MKKWVRRISCVFLTLLALALLAGFTYEQVASERCQSIASTSRTGG